MKKIIPGGRSPHTFQVLSIDGYRLFRVSKRKTAIPFEKYLKSASGRAFIKRHPPGGDIDMVEELEI
jgi:hypothetical protein